MTLQRSNWMPLSPAVKEKILRLQGPVPEADTSVPREPDWRPVERKKETTIPRQLNYREQCKARVWNDELGKLITCHSELLLALGWEGFVRAICQRGDLRPDPRVVGSHPAYHLLQHLSKHGAPAVTTTPPWSESQRRQRLKRGPHKSCRDHTEFLCD